MIPGTFPFATLKKTRGSGHVIEGSALFSGGSTSILTRTPASAGNSKKFKIHAVVKRGSLGAIQSIVGAVQAGTFKILFDTDDTINVESYYSSAYKTRLRTTQVFRDVGAYYVIDFEYDSTVSTPSASSIKLLVNGVQITAFNTATYPSQNEDAGWNLVERHRVGGRGNDTAQPFNGYIARVVNIDGVSDDVMGEITDDGFYQLNDVSELTFGTNGFLLEGGTNVAAGTDSSRPDGDGYAQNDSTPTMTNFTAPSGTVIYDSSHGTTYAAWKAFDKNLSTRWARNAAGQAGWVGYDFGTGKIIKKMIFTAPTSAQGEMPRNYTIEGGYSGGATYTITVQSVGGSNKYFVNGVQQNTLELFEGNTYIFNYPSGHPFKFSTTSDGTHGGGSEYTTGVTHNSSTRVTIVVATSAPTLYYYCSSHSGMGGTANTPAEWVVLDTITNAASYSASEQRVHTFTNTTSYTKYRVNITTSQDGANCTMGELAMFEAGNGVNHFIKTGTITATEDSPTDDSTNDYGNYATFNPLYPSSNVTLSNGNLTATFAGSGHYHFPANILIPATGKWALKATDINSAGRPSYQMIGVIEDSPASLTDAHDNTTSVYWTDQGVVYRAGSSLGVVAATYTQNDVLEILYDRDAATLKLYKGGVLSYTVTSVPTTANVFSAVANEAGTPVWTVDFGQNGYVATDTDYLNLSTANLPLPAIADPDDHFHSQVVTHDGSSTAATCTFNLDTYEWLAIIKNTTGATENWYMIDSLRGVTKVVTMNTNAAETTDANVLTVSGTTFTLGSTLGSKNYLVEFHKAGLAADTASNQEGSLNTTATSANLTSGFAISTYTGTGSNTNYGHGLNSAPEWTITKLRVGSTQGNYAWHVGLGDGTRVIYPHLANARDTAATVWNSTVPSATLNPLGNMVGTNTNTYTYVNWSWHSVDGYSKFGSYEGNTSTAGSFIPMGMSPNHVFHKCIDSAGKNWASYSKTIEPDNPAVLQFQFDLTAIPAGSTGVDLLSNGDKIRTTSGNLNDAVTYIYGAWGGRPLQGNGKDTSQGRAK